MDTTAVRSLSYGLYVVGVKSEGGFGGCVVDALVQITSDKPPTLLLGSVKGNASNGLIKSAGEFTISVLPEDVDPFIVANFGLQSARDVPDKWANVPHTIRDGLPVLDGAISYIRCRVADCKELSTHTAFYADVTDAWLGEATAKPLIYADYQANMKDAAKAALKKFNEGGVNNMAGKWVCKICGYAYDGEVPFEELPDDWTCPTCGVGKDQFEQE